MEADFTFETGTCIGVGTFCSGEAFSRGQRSEKSTPAPAFGCDLRPCGLQDAALRDFPHRRNFALRMTRLEISRF